MTRQERRQGRLLWAGVRRESWCEKVGALISTVPDGVAVAILAGGWNSWQAQSSGRAVDHPN